MKKNIFRKKPQKLTPDWKYPITNGDLREENYTYVDGKLNPLVLAGLLIFFVTLVICIVSFRYEFSRTDNTESETSFLADGAITIIDEANVVESERQESAPQTADAEEQERQESVSHTADAEEQEPQEPVISASDILICIDAGHFAGRNAVPDAYGYAEGDFTLRVALELSRILEEKYGIRSILTRTDGNISIDGYVNEGVDFGMIGLRGEMSDGCDLFFSIHTNANQDMANGYDTLYQPVNITKTAVILNQTAFQVPYAIDVGNAVGRNLSQVNLDRGLASVGTFQEADSMDQAVSWTDAWNDSLDIGGSICYRIDGDGDYYGVLSGANHVGVPGMIVEHGYHTVEEMREQAVTGDLATAWAEADADGIAEGFGITVK